jgi:electron transport protein HydN
VVGFDDIALAPYMVPSLASVRVPVTEMIKESINRLIFMLDGGEFNFQQSFPEALIERESLVAALCLTSSAVIVTTDDDSKASYNSLYNQYIKTWNVLCILRRVTFLLLEKWMNRFIIADASKCIGCRTCEVACVVSHQEHQDCASLTPHTFQPRIHVIKGVNVSTATACRQCEDAPCANVCPNGAISRDKGFVHVMQERCIGCKTCVVACPYGAMEVVVRPVIRHSGAGLNVVAEKAEANKCDLCFHRESGPACMEVCPTHALVCVDRNKLEQMNIEKRRRTALAW